MEKAPSNPEPGSNPGLPRKSKMRWLVLVLVVVFALLGGAFLLRPPARQGQPITCPQMVEYANAGRIHPEGLRLVAERDVDVLSGILLTGPGASAESGTPFYLLISHSYNPVDFMGALRSNKLTPELVDGRESDFVTATRNAASWILSRFAP